MHDFSRRRFLENFLRTAGCFAIWAVAPFAPATEPRTPPGRYRFPQGLASGDPSPTSVLLWTRVESAGGERGAIRLRVQVSRSGNFRSVVAEQTVTATAASDHTVRVLVDGLEPGTRYFYRFVAGSDTPELTGRTFTAPADDDPRPVRFAVASCQHIQLGTMSPYRRMIADDIARAENDRIQFLLHLGDFIYEEIWYPEDRATFLHRQIRDTVRMPDGGGEPNWRWPVSLADYRTIYKAYLADPDLMAARARWPFICIWDDHEYSNNSWQSHQMYDGNGQPAQRRKVAANQAWFEYIPARLSGCADSTAAPSPARDFEFADVADTPIDEFDDAFLGVEANNLAAIGSMTVYRALRWGAHVDLVLTDNRSYRSPPAVDADIGAMVTGRDTQGYTPVEVVDLLDAGRTANGGDAPATFEFDGTTMENPRRDSPPGTMLGANQKGWWKQAMKASGATWRIWANSVGLLSRRADFHQLPEPLRDLWKGRSYGLYNTDDWDGYPAERRELTAYLRDAGVSNVVSLAGDRHLFDAGTVPHDPADDDPVPVVAEFGTSSVTTPNTFEVYRYLDDRLGPMRPVYLYQPEGTTAADDALPAVNLMFRAGVESALELSRSGDVESAMARAGQPNPGLEFFDCAHFGYGVVTADIDALECEFVAFDAPLDPDPGPEGPPVIYRVRHRIPAWSTSSRPRVERVSLDGQLPLP